MRMFICLLAGGILLARPCLAEDDQLLEEKFERNYVELLQLSVTPNEKSQR